MGRPVKTCPECDALLRSTNRNGYCRRHRYLSELHRAVMQRAKERCDAKHPNRHRNAARRYYRKHPNRAKAATKTWRRKGGPKYMAWARRAAQRRRTRLVNAEGGFTNAEMDALLASSDRCTYCDCLLDGVYHVDHRFPLARGGTNNIENLTLACPSCNTSKGTMTDKEFLTTTAVVEACEAGAWVDL